ncbi:hypothetical protein PG999_014478 [Apiospora kogelbergensis]|uniref:Uncharacterized protein n=1 Tax=Apiospora kogelbergensis TaxID=1337665 RepID=A0AAW0Q4Z7_9PEZI
MTSADETTRFAHSVFAVREDDNDGRSPELVDQPLKLDALYKPSTSVLFRLSVPIANSTSTKTMIYVQITPDRIISLRHTTCETSDTSDQTPRCLDLVREQLGGARFVTRLQFQLHTGSHAQLVVPADFNLDDSPDSPARRVLASASSLATASSFSLYMPHNVLPMKKFRNFAHAVQQFPALTAAQRHAYERMVDLRSLYHGKGGKVFTSEEQDTAPATPAATESDAATVAVDTPSRYRDSPPQYEETPSEGRKPRDRSDATTASAESPARDYAPPAYEDGEQQCGTSTSNKRVLHCGSEDIDLHPAPKRRHPRATQLSEKSSWRLDSSEGRLQFQLERQRQQIEQLQEDIKALRRRNKELEGRHDELEEGYGMLEKRQVESEEAIESILVHTGELDDECEKLGRQMPDIGDEVEDWMRDSMGDRVKEYMADWLKENMSETIQEYITQQVTAQIVDVKMRMRSALGD